MNKEAQRVMIGTSLSAMSDPVVRTGVNLAKAAGAKVVLVHAFQPRMAYGGDTPYIADIILVEALETERKLAERRLAEQIERLGIRAEELASKRLEHGPAHRVLTDVAEALGVELLVIGSAESPRIAKVLGSTADRVIRKSLRPVLVVRGEPEVPFRKALLPVDLSVLSGVAFRRGLAVLDQMAGGAEVELEALYVMNDADPGIFDRTAPMELTEEAAARDLERFVARNNPRKERPIGTRIVQGEVEEAIRSRAQEWGADLVVLGTHGRGGFERFLLGSVAADVVRRGTTCVLVIPPVVEVEESKPVAAKEAMALQGVA